MIRSENTTHVTFTGHGTVFYEDSLGELDGIALGARQVSSVVRFELSQVIFILQLCYYLFYLKIYYTSQK